MSTLHVLTHAFLWSLMEVEIEGKRGWMYDSQTQCSGILIFTWYHISMNLIVMLTVTFILQPNIADKTHEEVKQTFVIWCYNLLLWFVVEDVGWFVVNGMTYRSAPWQSTFATVLSTVLPPALVAFMRAKKYKRDYQWDLILVPTILYMWLPFGTPFDPKEPYMPRHNFCMPQHNGVFEEISIQQK